MLSLKIEEIIVNIINIINQIHINCLEVNNITINIFISYRTLRMATSLLDSLTDQLSQLSISSSTISSNESLNKKKAFPLIGIKIRRPIAMPNVEEKVEEKVEDSQKRTEVQAHGFSWEKDLLINVYGLTPDELQQIKYTNKSDLPARFNRLDKCDVSIKTSCSPNAVCMADCLRVFDAVSSGEALHLVVVYYQQNDATDRKRVVSITEVDLTSSSEELFGTIVRSQLEELDQLVKDVPQKRKPTKDEYDKMYSLRNLLQPLSGAIHLDIKCNSTQSRLQCSFNRFQTFLRDHPERIIAHSNSENFRGGIICPEISSGRRCFTSK